MRERVRQAEEGDVIARAAFIIAVIAAIIGVASIVLELWAIRMIDKRKGGR